MVLAVLMLERAVVWNLSCLHCLRRLLSGTLAVCLLETVLVHLACLKRLMSMNLTVCMLETAVVWYINCLTA